MSLLHDIQSEILTPVVDLGSILLKVRLLAAKLGSQPLADWVKHESEGYPEGSPVPDYRIIPVQYTGTFSGPFGSGVNNAPIPSAYVEKLAGSHWTRFKMRQGVAAVDQLLSSLGKGEGVFEIDASNLIPICQGKIYPKFSCIAVSGKIPASALSQLKHSVQSRVLELTIELEKSIPEVSSITIGQSTTTSAASSGATTQIAKQIIYGNVTAISASGEARVSIGIQANDVDGVIQYLSARGIPAEDAKQFAAIVASEKPESASEPLGQRAATWLVENLGKAAAGTWNIGISVAMDVLKEAALRYYGLK
jgi:hypothetical protein